MKGLDLSREYYLQCGKPMLEESFSGVLDFIAVGLVGSGSECLGFDDDFSEDHDFEPAFCVFVPDEIVVDRRTFFQMERAYSSLPSEFMGYKRNKVAPVGGSRHGIIRTSEFFKDKIGSPNGILTVEQWLSLSEQSLLEATNGEIFDDRYGEVSNIRASLSFFPDDIFKKRLSACLLLMGQSGQYNYLRCLKHRETAAAQLSAIEFARNCISAVFLLNRTYCPYYKWTYRSLRQLPKLSHLADTMEYLITTGNDGEFSEIKHSLIEDAAGDIINELMEQNLTKAVCGDLEKHAYSVNDSIEDSYIRNLNILVTA